MSDNAFADGFDFGICPICGNLAALDQMDVLIDDPNTYFASWVCECGAKFEDVFEYRPICTMDGGER